MLALKTIFTCRKSAGVIQKPVVTPCNTSGYYWRVVQVAKGGNCLFRWVWTGWRGRLLGKLKELSRGEGKAVDLGWKLMEPPDLLE